MTDGCEPSYLPVYWTLPENRKHILLVYILNIQYLPLHVLYAYARQVATVVLMRIAMNWNHSAIGNI